MAKHGKAYVENKAKVDREHEYQPAEAISMVKALGHAKFDESIELHIRTGLNVRHADEQLRGTIALPHGLGRDVTIAVFAKGPKADEAREAGADFVYIPRLHSASQIAGILKKGLVEGFDAVREAEIKHLTLRREVLA